VLYDTPETLRDGILANIAEVRKTTDELIRTGKNITVYDESEVSSDNPPQPESAETHPPSDTIKRTLRTQAEQQLARKEAVIREHFQAIHAAIQRALPLAELKQTLLDLGPTATAK
jgi:hypothetical protein